MGDAALYYCPCCRDLKPPDPRFAAIQNYTEAATALLCAECRDRGGKPAPPMLEDVASLRPSERKALAVLIEGGTAYQAAEESGLARRTVREMQAGRRKPEFLAAYQAAMASQGLDIPSMIRGLREALHAQKYQWDPDAKCWTAFPDYGVRLRALQTIAKMHHVDSRPNDSNPAAAASVEVHIHTNLDDPAPESNDAFHCREAERDVTEEAERIS